MNENHSVHEDLDIQTDVTTTGPTKVQVVNCVRLNIRKNPSTKSPVIKVVQVGDVIEFNPKYNNPGFYELRMDGNGKGYGSKDFLKKLSD